MPGLIFLGNNLVTCQGFTPFKRSHDFLPGLSLRHLVRGKLSYRVFGVDFGLAIQFVITILRWIGKLMPAFDGPGNNFGISFGKLPKSYQGIKFIRPFQGFCYAEQIGIGFESLIKNFGAGFYRYFKRSRSLASITVSGWLNPEMELAFPFFQSLTEKINYNILSELGFDRPNHVDTAEKAGFAIR